MESTENLYLQMMNTKDENSYQTLYNTLIAQIRLLSDDEKSCLMNKTIREIRELKSKQVPQPVVSFKVEFLKTLKL